MILITDDTELRILARGKKVRVVGSANLKKYLIQKPLLISQ